MGSMARMVEETDLSYFSLERRRGHGFDGFLGSAFSILVIEASLNVVFDAGNINREHAAHIVMFKSVTVEFSARNAGNDFTTATLGDERRGVTLSVSTVSFQVSGEAVNILATVQRSNVVVARVVTSVEETVVVVFITDEGKGFRSPRAALDGTVDVHFVAVFDARVVEREPYANTVDQARFAVFNGTTSVTRCVLGQRIFQGSAVILCRRWEEF